MNMIAYRQDFLGDALGEGFRRASGHHCSDKFIRPWVCPTSAKGVMRFMDMEGVMGGVVGGNGGWGMSAHYDPQNLRLLLGRELRGGEPRPQPALHDQPGGMDRALSFEQAMPVGITHWGKDIAENGLNDLHRKRDVPLTWNGQKSAKANAYLGQFIHYRGCIKDSITVCDWVYPDHDQRPQGPRLHRRHLGRVQALRAWSPVKKMTQKTLDDRAARIWVLHRLLTVHGMGRRQGGQPARRARPDARPLLRAPVETRLLPSYPPADPPHPAAGSQELRSDQGRSTTSSWAGTSKTGLPKRSLHEAARTWTKVLATFEKAQAFSAPELIHQPYGILNNTSVQQERSVPAFRVSPTRPVGQGTRPKHIPGRRKAVRLPGRSATGGWPA